jgi:hypothetical protein
MTFKIGDKVRFDYDETIGEVLEVRDDNVSTGAKYLIKWEGAHCVPDWEHSSHLTLINLKEEARIAKKIQSKIDVAKSALEEAWEAFSEAKEIAYKHNYSLATMHRQGAIDIAAFRDVAENFGWSSSSLSC